MLRSKQTISLPILITLKQNQSFRLPELVDELQVFSGCAWMTVAGQDIILNNQQIASIPHSKEGAIISPIGQEILILELRTKATSLIQ
ncbi:hypothetical protein Nos7524_2669 [Nostoc sp. PCC 7524]|uniref:hypothetical protein n=1 Tax=Nostoc sp. (strain ATCC 29411 / PCC 7524) TaxID=28072 RepID=UPI00029F1A2F|nr:hypothetical protein [Nostoc sp. PCC 7524]AFY48502.1 hypothetical protein Nos7524_2669 [Nostoc sp. PCC 7524]